MRSNGFHLQYLRLRTGLARFFGYTFYVLVAVAAIVLAISGVLIDIPCVNNGVATTFVVGLLLTYIVQERAVLESIRECLKPTWTKYLEQRDSLYMAIAQTVVDVESVGGKHTLLLASLHDDVDRVLKPQRRNTAFDAFDSLMMQCIKSPKWEVRNIFQVATPERLEQVLRRIEQTKAVDGFEVRAFCCNESLPHLSPLIIGDDHLFLAVDDSRYIRAKDGLHIQGHEAVLFATVFFESLWNDEKTFKLKSASGPNPAEIDRLRAALGSSAPGM